MVDERGANVVELEVQTSARSAEAWSASQSHAPLGDAKLSFPAAPFDAEGVRTGSPWHLWSEFDPAQHGREFALEPVGRLRAIVHSPDASAGARWRLSSPTGEFHAPAIGARAVFERLRPANYCLELSALASGVVESLGVLIEPRRTQRAYATLPPTDDQRPATFAVTPSDAEFDALRNATRLVLRLAPHPSEDDGADRFRRPVESAVNGGWSARFVGLAPDAHSLALEPLGFQRELELPPAEQAELRIDIVGLARTAVTFHRATTGEAFVPRQAYASLVTQGTRTLVTATLATDGSLAHVLYTPPGELFLSCSDEGWAAPATRLQLAPGWNAVLIEVAPAGRLTPRLPPEAGEASDEFWRPLSVRRADTSAVDLGRRYRPGAGESGDALELTLPAGETLEIATPKATGATPQQFRVKLAAGERRQDALKSR